jgi:hypothetical protein
MLLQQQRGAHQNTTGPNAYRMQAPHRPKPQPERVARSPNSLRKASIKGV